MPQPDTGYNQYLLYIHTHLFVYLSKGIEMHVADSFKLYRGNDVTSKMETTQKRYGRSCTLSILGNVVEKFKEKWNIFSL